MKTTISSQTHVACSPQSNALRIPQASISANAHVDEDGSLVVEQGNNYLECALFLRDISPVNLVHLYTLAQDIGSEELACVLAGWNLEDGAWIERSPLLLRFEYQDVLVEPTADGLRLWRGIIDEHDNAFLPDSPLPTGKHLRACDQTRQMRERCLRSVGIHQTCWLPFEPLLFLVGSSARTLAWTQLLRAYLHTAQLVRAA